MDDLLLRPEEAARALRISRSKLYTLIDQGELQAVHIGRSRRVPTEALQEYVQRLRETSAPGVNPGR